MALVEKSVLVEHSARQMFDLVDRVEDYAQFLPWCGGTVVHSRDAQTVVATIHIDFHRLTQSFTTENMHEAPNLIHVRLREGPFQALDGLWRFTELTPEASKVELRLHYEFSNKLVENIVSPVFGVIVGSLVEAFVTRAEQIYAK